jgi:hypothetical protein
MIWKEKNMTFTARSIGVSMSQLPASRSWKI